MPWELISELPELGEGGSRKKGSAKLWHDFPGNITEINLIDLDHTKTVGFREHI